MSSHSLAYLCISVLSLSLVSSAPYGNWNYAQGYQSSPGFYNTPAAYGPSRYPIPMYQSAPYYNTNYNTNYNSGYGNGGYYGNGYNSGNNYNYGNNMFWRPQTQNYGFYSRPSSSYSNGWTSDAYGIHTGPPMARFSLICNGRVCQSPM